VNSRLVNRPCHVSIPTTDPTATVIGCATNTTAGSNRYRSLVGLRERFLRALTGDDAAADDPDDFVELEVVPLYDGPLAVHALRSEGIEPVCTEQFSVVTKTISQLRIMVPRKSVSRATEILHRL
jgi:hypothetical protein